jgi:hypothetical protein
MARQRTAIEMATDVAGIPQRVMAQPRRLEGALHWGLTLFFASLPFELNAGFGVAALTFTNLELLLPAVLGLWSALLFAERRLPRIPRWFVIPMALFLGLMAISAVAAPEWRSAALKFTARQLQGALLALCLADQLSVAGFALARRLGIALLIGACLSGLLGLLELTEAAPILALLSVFKDDATLAGGLLRLSATFTYANIAAMFYEAALPLMLVAVGLVARRLWLLCAAGALLLYVAALLTYSRASLITATAAIVLVSLAALARYGRRGSGLRVAGTSAVLLTLLVALLAFSPAFRVRIAEPDVAQWYRVTYTASPIPSIAPNAKGYTTVTLRNDGLMTWQPGGARPIALSYHWLDATTGKVVRYNGLRTALPRPISPGETMSLRAVVQAPDKVGVYVLAWDMVQEHTGWFSEWGNPVPETRVEVAGAAPPSAPAAPAESSAVPQRVEVVPPPPSRRLLWGAALALWSERPLLGIGPSVFRRVYGPELGLTTWDDRIHTNNLYLELLVGTGVVGLAAFLGLVGAVMLPAARALWPGAWRVARVSQMRRLTFQVRRSHHTALQEVSSGAVSDRSYQNLQIWWALLGCAVGLTAFLLHGVLDTFLEYTATYCLLWAFIGALVGLTQRR